MMKRLSLLLVVMFMLGLMVPSFAETVTIGTGTETARYPMDFFWKSSLYQTLYYPDELGFTSGTITALEFYNNFTQDLSGKPTKIWLGTTNQPNLATGFIPANQLTLVYDGTINYPTGENTISITLQTSYTHTPGNLVLLVQRPMDTEYFSSSNYFKCQTVGSDRARYYRSDGTEADPNSPPAGTATGQFPMTKITYTPVTIVNDLGATGISGLTTPTVGISYNYIISVKNNGTASQSTYQVKLMSGTTELASVAGPALNSLETADVVIAWTPTTAGAMSIYGKVVLAGDEFPVNDETAPLNLSVQPAGTHAITIGAGDENARIPMDFYWKNSLFQCLYYPDELGIMSGTISSIAFYNDFVTNNPPGATKVWLGSTTALDLSGGWIPSTQMTLVFDGNVDYPSGQNTITIPLQTPFEYTSGNLVMMVLRPTDTSWHSSSDYFKCQTVGNSRALNYYSDSTPNDPASPTGGTLSGKFPQTTFFYTGGVTIDHDLGLLSIAGNTTPSVGAAEVYTVTVKNNGQHTESNYQVKLMTGTTELASVAGPAIQPQQVIEVELPWTPATTGTIEVFGQLVMTGDQVDLNNQTLPLTVSVQAAGVVAVTVGDGGSTGRYPFDFWYRNSIFETVYQASELNIGGVITGIQYYNNFANDLTSIPIKVWMAETPQTNLSGGFIPATEMDLVFDGTMNFPSGANDIFIPIDPPWPYGGGNLVVMSNRPMNNDMYSSGELFVTQTGSITGRSRYLRSDSTEYDPNNPAAGNATADFPKTTFFLVTEGMGALSGTVYGPGNAPIEGATVSVANSNLVYTTGADGTYSFPYIYEGAQTVSATKHGYTVDTHTVTIVEDQTTTQNFNIAQLPQVTVTGRIVGSDAPTVGIADATINLTGYEPYSATTNAQGQFTITNVYASQTYEYVARATGYQNATGQAVVGTVNLNMGDITVNEIAFPPAQVVAEEAADGANCSVTWAAPGTAGGEWLNYSGEKDDSVGLTSGGTMHVAARYAPAGLTDYAGMSIHALKVWPAQPATYVAKVWTGGSATVPGPEAVAQPFTPAELDVYNTVVLTEPVLVTGSEELWFGYSAEHSGGNYPCGVDAGPAVNGFGNMVEFGGTWQTLLSAGLDGNWCIQGYVGWGAPTDAPRISTFSMAQSEIPSLGLSVSVDREMDRSLVGYRVWRLTEGQENNEAAWTSLTTSNITNTNFTDNTWQPLPSAVYKYAVKAVYTNNVFSNPAFSNAVHKGMMGTLTGTVTEFGTDLPIEGASIVAGEYSGTSNAQGVYSFSVYAGTYEVTCSKVGYQPASQAGVVMVGLQTTTQDFVLTEITLPPGAVVAEEVAPNVNVTWMEPGTSGGEWLNYSGEKDDSVGLTSGGVMSVAARYDAAGLADYSGMSLQALKVWPAQAATYAARVWTGGTATAPGTEAVNQPFTPAELDVYNTVLLTNPVPVPDGELWFGYSADHTAGNYPCGVDAGPAVNGYGNMVEFGGNWQTLLSAGLDGNWCIQGYVGYSAPTDAPRISMPGSFKTYAGMVNKEKSADRALTGYRVWRLRQGQETNESTWTSLTPNPISATGFQDTEWANVEDGTYKWAVKAIYTGGAASVAALSNPLPKVTQIGTIVGIVRNQQNATISGATITCAGYSATTNQNGAYSMQVIAGTHSVTASHPDYDSVTQENVTVVTGQTTTVNFVLPPSSVLFQDGFESYPDFALEFAPWTLVDVDQQATYRIGGYDWPNAESPMAYIIFNPSATTPPVTALEPHGGSKVAASFAAVNPPNNDWMITPQLSPVSELKFWARSYNSAYGLEKFKVGVSTTGTAPNNFTFISGATPIEAPIEWTEYTYDLTQYTETPVYIGINCVSHDVFFFIVDDVIVKGATDADDPTVPVLKTALNINYPNPFNPETTISYSLKQGENVKIEVYNIKGQLVRTLVNEEQAAGNHKVVWTGVDNNNRPVSSGVYFYKMTAGKYSSSKKMILMK